MTPDDNQREDRQHTAENGIVRWRCLNCGQTHFTHADETPPDICYYCRDMTTWKRLPPIQNPTQKPD